MGSGMGKTSTRGSKGQRSRSGSRLLRGFDNIFKKEYAVVNLDRIAALGQTSVTLEVLRNAGLVGKNDLVKVLGDGELSAAITVQAHRFSKSAQEKIAKAGGKAETIGERREAGSPPAKSRA
jgi:large subunit ribosomal protein L15